MCGKLEKNDKVALEHTNTDSQWASYFAKYEDNAMTKHCGPEFSCGDHLLVLDFRKHVRCLRLIAVKIVLCNNTKWWRDLFQISFSNGKKVETV